MNDILIASFYSFFFGVFFGFLVSEILTRQIKKKE